MPRRAQLAKFFVLKSLLITHEIGTPMSTYLSEFNSIFSQLVALENIIDYEFKATFLLFMLPKGLDIFRTVMRHLNVMLLYVDVESPLLIEEMNQQKQLICPPFRAYQGQVTTERRI